MPNSRLAFQLLFKKTAALLTAFFFAGSLCSKPAMSEMINLEGGKVDINVQDNVTNIGVTGNPVWNVDHFNVAQGSIYNLTGLSSGASLAMLVGGGQVSNIFGTMNISNLAFILQNVYGINIGASGIVNLNQASLIASTLPLNLTATNFLTQQYSFGGGPGSLISNSGKIIGNNAELVALISNAIENKGTIEVPMGTVVLAAGKTVTVGISPDGMVSIGVDEATANSMGLKDQIKNTGTIEANGGKVILNAQAVDGLFEKAINIQRSDKAVTAIRADDGTIEFKSIDDIYNAAIIQAQRGLIKVKSTQGAVTNAGTMDAAKGNIEIRTEGRIENAGIIRASIFREHGSTFNSNGVITGGKAYYDNTDGAATISGSIGSDQIDTGNLIVAGNITLTADNLFFTADSDNDGFGVFYMTSAYTINGGGYGLTIKTGSTAAEGSGINGLGPKLGSFSNVSRLTLEKSTDTPMYTSDPTLTTWDIDDFQMATGAQLNRFSGEGSVETPYQIYDVYGLQAMNGFLANSFKLHNSIDASSTSGWNSGAGFVPVGSAAAKFTGKFDGDLKSIRGLFINRPLTDYVGLFGYLDSNANIKNVGLTGLNVTGKDYVGGFSGMFGFSALSNVYATGAVGGRSFVGGLIGKLFASSTVIQSYSEASVTGIANVGGLVGGAIFSVVISNSYATGSVSGNTAVGGLVGQTFYDCAISKSYATGPVTGVMNNSTESSNIGGLVGINAGAWGDYGSSIDNSYATGTVTGTAGTTNTGGLIGSDDGVGSLTNNWWFNASTKGVGSSGSNESAGHWQKTGALSDFYGAVPGSAVYAGWTFGDGNNGWVGFSGKNPHLDWEWSQRITNLLELQNMSIDLTADYTLAGDLDASDTANWNSGLGFNPVGNNADPFSGTFSGRGYAITNLYINRPTSDYVGLFGYMDTAASSAQQVSMVSVNVTGRDYTGGLVGYNHGGNISSVDITGDVTGDDDTGGLAGTNTGNISIIHSGVTVNGATNVGGLAGSNQGGGLISKSLASGSVTGTGDSVGGLAGSNAGNITNTYSSAEVNGASKAGGLVGNNSSVVDRSYAFGAVHGSDLSSSGGLVGSNTGDVTNSFYDSSTTGQSDDTGKGTPKSTSQLMSPATFSGWDFSVAGDGTIGNWVMAERPYLQLERTTIITTLAELQMMAIDLGAAYTLAGSLDASTTSGWNAGMGFNPVGDSSNKFTGSFEGANHIISGLYIHRTDTDDVGLFGATDGAMIQQLRLASVNIAGRDNVGGLAGSTIAGSIFHVYTTGYVTGDDYVGGLVGANGNSISNVYSLAAVSGSTNVGGLAGSNSSTVDQSYSAGAVTGNTDKGGLIGSNTGDVTNSYYDSTTTGQSDDAGKGTPRTTGQMMSSDTFTGWNFESAGNGPLGNWILAGRPHFQLEWTASITDVAQLQMMALDLSASYTLANDIDASGTSEWNDGAGFAPVGNEGAWFKGTFDGNGKTIDGLFVSRSGESNIGLFGVVSGATIKNIGLTQLNVTGGSNVGGLVGLGYRDWWGTSSTIKNSFVSGTVTGSGDGVGGLVGYNDDFAISDSYSVAAVTGNNRVGGLVGQNVRLSIIGSYATGEVHGLTDGVGGLIGYIQGGTVADTYATGKVTGNLALGGLVGSSNGTISNSYAIGLVNNGVEAATVGGLVGVKTGGTVTNSFWNKETSGQTTSAAGTGKSTAEMKATATFTGAGWNPYGTWIINAATYPTLGYNPLYNIWIALGAGLWSNAANWSKGTVPDASSIIVFSRTSVADSIIDNSVFLGLITDLSINSDYTGTITQSRSLSITGNYVQSGGTFISDPAYDFSAANFSIPAPGASGSFLRFSTGDGSSENPYCIKDIYGLQGMNGLLSSHFFLNNDFSAAVAENWNSGAGFVPVGNNSYDFTGVFDGNGKTIDGLFINRPSENGVALFGVASGTIKNIGLTHVDATGNSWVGGLVGRNYGSVSNSHSAGNVTGSSYVGGLVGRNSNAIASSYASGVVTGTSNVAGLVGMNEGNIMNSYYDIGDMLINGVHRVTDFGIYSDQFAAWVGTPTVSLNLTDYFHDLDMDGSYEINNVTDLKNFLAFTHMTSYDPDTGDKFKLIGNITVPEGFYIPYLTVKEFDGNGNVISGLKVDHAGWGDNLGFFGYAYGSAIKNIGIEAAVITGGHNVGGLVGFSGSVSISNSFSDATVNGGTYVGGLVGYQIFTTITDSYTTGDVKGTGSSVGGLVGEQTNSTVTRSYATGDVNGGGYVGGLVGYSVQSSVVDDYASGDVTGGGDVGGLIGRKDLGTLENDYAAGDVTGIGDNIGGLVGFNMGDWEDININNVYAAGNVSGRAYVGGLVGYNLGHAVNNSFATGTVSATTLSVYGGLVGGGNSDFTNSYYVSYNNGIGLFESGGKTSFYGNIHDVELNWDFNTIWDGYATGLPHLQWENHGTPLSAPSSVVKWIYDGSGDSSWSTSANWSSGSVPGPGSLVWFSPLYSNRDCVIDRSAAVFGLKLSSNYTGTVTQASNVAISGIYTQANGTFTATDPAHDTFSAADFRLAGGSFNRYTGSGTSEEPYLIYDVYGLQNMLNNLSSGFKLAQNINAFTTSGWNNGAGFVPVGAQLDFDINLKFQGNLDGQNHTITGLYINRPDMDYVGLFGAVNGSRIQDIGLVSVSIIGRSVAGALAGYGENSTITGVYTAGDVTSLGNGAGGVLGGSTGGSIDNVHSGAHVIGANCVGGLIGEFDGGAMNSSYATGNVTGGVNTGGLVGVSNFSNITGSRATGKVAGTDNTGGLAGYSLSSAISSAYATGEINGHDYVGGLVGNNDLSDIADSYATGKVVGYDRVGGLVGYSNRISRISNTSSTPPTTGDVIGHWYVGGLVGHNSFLSSISGGNSKGNVDGVNYVGGLVGKNDNDSTVENSTASGDVRGIANIDPLIGNRNPLTPSKGSQGYGTVTQMPESWDPNPQDVINIGGHSETSEPPQNWSQPIWEFFWNRLNARNMESFVIVREGAVYIIDGADAMSLLKQGESLNVEFKEKKAELARPEAVKPAAKPIVPPVPEPVVVTGGNPSEPVQEEKYLMGQSKPATPAVMGDAEGAGRYATLKNPGKDVFVKCQGGEWQAAKDGMVILPGDVVKTAAAGSVEVMLDGGKVGRVEIKEGSIFRINKTETNPATGDKTTLLDLAIGKMIAHVEKLKGESKFEVRTPTVLTGVRGTVFEVVVRGKV